MKKQLLTDIFTEAVAAADPYESVFRAVGERFAGYTGEKPVLLGIGKAACQMAKGAYDALDGGVKAAFALTKYGHTPDDMPAAITVFEAGHPVPDKNGFDATAKILEYTGSLTPSDRLVFLISGGGSALFESPLIPPEELKDVTNQLLACSAEINEINSVRKRLSAVKGGKFAARTHCPVFQVILSDVLGDRLDSIASGPAAPDMTTADDIRSILSKYPLRLSAEALRLLRADPPEVAEPDFVFAGNVHILCSAAAEAARTRGIEPVILSESLTGEARERGRELAEYALGWKKDHPGQERLFILGGETTVTLHGKGKGGRSQELALAAAEVLSGGGGVYLLAAGSDGTDGPTDAAGGYADGDTSDLIKKAGGDLKRSLAGNDAYNALKKADSLVITGATGTNVNDLTLILVTNR